MCAFNWSSGACSQLPSPAAVSTSSPPPPKMVRRSVIVRAGIGDGHHQDGLHPSWSLSSPPLARTSLKRRLRQRTTRNNGQGSSLPKIGLAPRWAAGGVHRVPADDVQLAARPSLQAEWAMETETGVRGCRMEETNDGDFGGRWSSRSPVTSKENEVKGTEDDLIHATTGRSYTGWQGHLVENCEKNFTLLNELALTTPSIFRPHPPHCPFLGQTPPARQGIPGVVANAICKSAEEDSPPGHESSFSCALNSGEGPLPSAPLNLGNSGVWMNAAVSYDDDRAMIGTMRPLPGNDVQRFDMYRNVLVDPSIVEQPDSDGDIPLHIAVAKENENAVAQLIGVMTEFNLSLDICNNLQQTSLHVALITGNANIVRRLLASGACPTVPDRHGNTAVHLAVRCSPLEVIRITLDFPASLKALYRYNYSGFTPLHLAVFRRDLEVISLLIAKGAECNCLDGTSGRTPLFHAVLNGQEDVVARLIVSGASVNMPNYSGVTPLVVATDRRFKNITSLLISKGATINSRDDVELALRKCCNATENPPHFNSSNEVLFPSREITDLNCFILDCIQFWELRHPKIFLSEGASASKLLSRLSKSGIQAVVRTGFSEECFREVIQRDFVRTNVIVSGNRTVIQNALSEAFSLEFLKLASTLILVCLDCNQHDALIIHGNDIVGSVIIGVSPKEHFSEFELFQLVFDYGTRSLDVTPIGQWRVSGGIHVLDSIEQGLMTTALFQNATLNVFITGVLPYVSVKKKGDTFVNKGYIVDVVELIRSILNVSMNITTEVNAYGQVVNGTAMNGSLVRFVEGNYDLGAGVFSMTSARAEIMEFTSPFLAMDVLFVAQVPDEFSGGLTRFVSPFTMFPTYVWRAVAFLFGMSLVLTAAASHWASHFQRKQFDWFSNVLAAWLHQCAGGVFAFNTISSKILLLTMCFTSWMLLCFYGAVLTSHFTVEAPLLITTLKHLVASDYTTGITLRTSYAEDMQRSGSSVVQNIYKNSEKSATTAEGLRKMCRRQRYAHLSPMAIVTGIVNPSVCPYYFIKQVVFVDYNHFIAPKGSVLQKRISKIFMRLKETGILERFEDRHGFKLRMTRETRDKNKLIEIELRHLIVPFCILMIGIPFSVFALVAEISYKKWKNCK